MKGMNRTRILAALVTVLMLFALMPAQAAYADDSGTIDVNDPLQLIEACYTESVTTIRLTGDIEFFPTMPITILGDVTIDLNGHKIDRKISRLTENGHVFEVLEGSLTGGPTLTITDSSATETSPGTGMITGGWSGYGGGIYVHKYGTLNLCGGTITGNQASDCGGGVFLEKDAVFNLKGGIISGNGSDGYGGGVFLVKGSALNLKGGMISGNTATLRGGGVYAEKNAGVFAEGSPVVQGNHASSGNNIFLRSGYKISITGALKDESQIGISLEDDQGVFTDGYSGKNGGKDPGLFFTSDDGCRVVEKNGEAALDTDTFGETDDEFPFIEWKDQIKADTDALGSRNWMAGISGERCLNEINLPGSHDAGMNNVQDTGDGCDITSTLTGSAAGGIEGHVIGEYMARTQNSYIDEQLANGSRLLDIRLTDRKKIKVESEDPIYWYVWDDNEAETNTWLCHGESTDTGSYIAWNRNNEELSFAEVLGWVENFLEKHPTETVILHIRPQSTDHSHYNTIYQRVKNTLKQLAVDKNNNSTGEPFLYKEPGSSNYFAKYTHVPQLKDCRGKIVLWFEWEGGTDYCGGFWKDSLFDGKYTDPTDHTLNESAQIVAIESEYTRRLNPGGDVKLPGDANENCDFLWHWELNCTGEKNWWDYGLEILQGRNPVSLAVTVNHALLGNDKVFGVNASEIPGQYIGWVKMDGLEARYTKAVWSTNFFGGQKYCTVTVKSGTDDGDPVFPAQTYRLLKGTTITIPGNIYKKTDSLEELRFEGWTGSGSDAALVEGETYTVDQDVTFTAKWKKTVYSVKFDSNVPANASTACTGSMEDQSFKYDVKKALSANGYSLPGYDFDGWNTKTDGTGTPYADKAEVQDLSEDGSPVTLYAQWNAKPYRITYQSDDAGSQTYVQTAYFDQPGKLDKYSDAAFGWDSGGYTLHGWAGTGFGFFYEDGDTFSNLCGAPDADGNVSNAVLTADWIQNGQIVVTVTKNGVPQEGLAEYIVLGQGGETFNVPIEYSDGKYVFDPASVPGPGGQPAQLPPGKYDLQFNAAGYPSASARITYAGGDAVSVVFEYFTVSLTKDAAFADFNDVEINGGEAIEGEPGTVVALDGDELNIKTAVGEGYRFAGYTAVGVAPVWEGDDPSKADQTITVQGRADIKAHVEPVEYYVTVEGGTADKVTARLGETVTITADTPEPGKAFVQWAQIDGINFDSTSSISTSFTMPARDVTVTAVFAPIVIGSIGDKPYTGSNIEPTDEVEVSLDGADLMLTADDYTVSFEDNLNAGDAKVIVTMKSPRAGSAVSTFKITPLPATITVNSASKVQGEDDPPFTGKVEGLVAAGDLGKIRYVRKGSDEAAGTYEGVLTAVYDLNSNYDTTVIPGDFTITAMPVQKGTLTFDPAGGTLNGKTGKLTIEANVGDVITIPDAPVRDGYTFKYWKGSKYHPGDKYTVEGDHGFTAVWKDAGDKNGTGAGTGDDSHILLWLILMTLSLLGLTVTAVIRLHETDR